MFSIPAMPLQVDDSRSSQETRLLSQSAAPTPTRTNQPTSSSPAMPPSISVPPNPVTPSRPPPPPPRSALAFGPSSQLPQQSSSTSGSEPAILDVPNPVELPSFSGSQPVPPVTQQSTCTSANPIPTPSKIPVRAQAQVPAAAPLSLPPLPRQTAVASQKKTTNLYVTKRA